MTIIPLHQKQQSDSFVLLQYKVILFYLNNLIMTITEIVWLLVKKNLMDFKLPKEEECYYYMANL
ncbi:MAG: hypothetical protein C0412_03705 [Flavobacterium sp.]|nr:hypothetical protein [Flavobacterium sp.]